MLRVTMKNHKMEMEMEITEKNDDLHNSSETDFV
jgi:hypothetical protein